MRKFIILILCLVPLIIEAQTDILILKRRGRHVHTYTIGEELDMQTVYRQWITGTITLLRNDSVFVNGIPFHNKEIRAIRRDHHNFGNTTLPYGMMAVGTGIFVLNGVNGAYRQEKPREWYTTSNIITGASLLASGFLLSRTGRPIYHIGHRFRLQYLDLTSPRSPIHSPVKKTIR